MKEREKWDGEEVTVISAQLNPQHLKCTNRFFSSFQPMKWMRAREQASQHTHTHTRDLNKLTTIENNQLNRRCWIAERSWGWKYNDFSDSDAFICHGLWYRFRCCCSLVILFYPFFFYFINSFVSVPNVHWIEERSEERKW